MAGEGPCLVFDVGGTSLRAATYDVRSQQIGSVVIANTPSESRAGSGAGPLPGTLAMMQRLGTQLLASTSPAAVCVGFPGPIDHGGALKAAPTISGPQYPQAFPLRSRIAECWPDSIVEVVNDVTAAGYAFVDDRHRDFLVVTVGSGIGSKLFLGGLPVLGPNARGGEIGHVRVDPSPNALVCDCGGIGHLGAIASGRGVLRGAIRHAVEDPAAFRESPLHEACLGRPERLDNSMLVDAFRTGDAWARDMVVACAAFLGRMLASIHLTTGIETYRVIGGFAAALGDEYRDILAEAAEASMWSNGFSWCRGIHVSKPDDHAGLRGAGRLLALKYGDLR